MYSNRAKALGCVPIVVSVGPPSVKMDSVILVDQALDRINNPCVVVTKYREVEPTFLGDLVVVTVLSHCQKTVSQFDPAAERTKQSDKALVKSFSSDESGE